MNIISVNVFDSKDNQRVFAALESLKKEKAISYTQIDDIGLPGEPLTVEELKSEIAAAENSKKYSLEDAKKMSAGWR